MRFYTQQHRHYCGIDLHAHSMYICVLDQTGNTLLHKKPTATESSSSEHCGRTADGSLLPTRYEAAEQRAKAESRRAELAEAELARLRALLEERDAG